MSDDKDILLARIDERTNFLAKEMHAISQKLENKYVTQEEFIPVRKLTYGLVALSLAAVLASLLKIVLGA